MAHIRHTPDDVKPCGGWCQTCWGCAKHGSPVGRQAAEAPSAQCPSIGVLSCTDLPGAVPPVVHAVSSYVISQPLSPAFLPSCKGPWACTQVDMLVYTSGSLLHTALLSHSANQSGSLAVESMGVTWKEPCTALELESRLYEERIPGITASWSMAQMVWYRFPVSTSCPIRLLTMPRDVIVELHSTAFPSTGPTSNLNLLWVESKR